MKIIQSFWSKPSTLNLSSRSNGGWAERKYQLMAYSLSCLQLRRFYDQVELVTDELGSQLFAALDLPYTKVVLALDALNEYDADLWSLAKVHTFCNQREPFLHVDHDVFIFEKLHAALEHAPLVMQNKMLMPPECNLMLLDMMAGFAFVPTCFSDHAQSDEDFISVFNPGVSGGSDVEFLEAYAREVFAFVNNNLHIIDAHLPYLERDLMMSSGTNKIDIMNAIIESYIFTCFTGKHNRNVACVLDDASYNTFPQAQFIGQRGSNAYVHPIFGFKKNMTVCAQLEYKLRKHHPDHYFKIIDILEELDTIQL
ncbi:DUF6734 family protein [Chryseolinea lacunae]|uniref:DUF6734 domain-containing protein n=1 Tax=Chryseolinea lacunae TaxID=2801331 RepID=A0ABS1KRT4_9BACT|nr:DUF6734 family protein [Chryseolinea lacunae]MBL0741382.1 hypothetical protein [Chryseolinea lacunae]